MLEKFNEKFTQAKDVFTGLPASRQVLLGSLAALVVAALIVLFVWTNRVEYDVLYTNLSQDDAGAVVEKLSERKIPYQLDEQGTLIRVPSDIVHETRLALATEGLPTGGGVGMEMFDKTSLGATEFVQRLNFQRALQGELERTISQFQEVETARVHLSIPKESLFIEEEKPTTASVVLKMKRGRELERSQLAGVVHLVSSSVEGLESNNVTVVDTAGGLLYSKDEQEGQGLLSATQMQQLKSLETSLSRNVESLLTRVVGPGKAMARVTAEMNFQHINTVEEIYDPDRSGIRSEQRIKEVTQGAARGAEGPPTARYDLGASAVEEGEGAERGEFYQRTDDTTNYEITKINREIISPAGDIKRLSVAVMVDQAALAGGEGAQPVEVKSLEDLVKSAVGFSEDRGDMVTVTPIDFYVPEEEVLAWWQIALTYLKEFGKPAVNILLIVLFFLFVVRPIVAWFRSEVEPEPLPEAEQLEALPEGEEAERERLPEAEERMPLTRENVLLVAQQNPERTINLIRGWIEER